MGRYLTEDREFKSDKYDWCPTGFFPMKLTDPIAQLCIQAYAELTDQIELADDLVIAIEEIRKETQ